MDAHSASYRVRGYVERVSKAFTKEDDDAGFQAPRRASSLSVREGRVRLTGTGARALYALAAGTEVDAPKLAAMLGHAEILDSVRNPTVASLGVTVEVVDERGHLRAFRLVTADERALLADGCSLASPIGCALLGARVGEVREVTTPRGVEALEVTALVGERTE